MLQQRLEALLELALEDLGQLLQQFLHCLQLGPGAGQFPLQHLLLPELLLPGLLRPERLLPGGEAAAAVRAPHGRGRQPGSGGRIRRQMGGMGAFRLHGGDLTGLPGSLQDAAFSFRPRQSCRLP